MRAYTASKSYKISEFKQFLFLLVERSPQYTIVTATLVLYKNNFMSKEIYFVSNITQARPLSKKIGADAH